MTEVFYCSVRAGRTYVDAAGGPHHYGRMFAKHRMHMKDPDRWAWFQQHGLDPLVWQVQVDYNPPPCDRVIKAEIGRDIVMRIHIVFEDPQMALLYKLVWQ